MINFDCVQLLLIGKSNIQLGTILSKLFFFWRFWVHSCICVFKKTIHSLFLDSQEYLFLPGFIQGFSQHDNCLLFSGLPVTPSVTAYLKLLQILIEQLTWPFVLDYKYRLLPPKSEYQQVRRPYPPS